MKPGHIFLIIFTGMVALATYGVFEYSTERENGILEYRCNSKGGTYAKDFYKEKYICIASKDIIDLR